MTDTSDNVSAIEKAMEGVTPGPWLATRKFEVGIRSQADDQSNGMIVPFCDLYGDDRDANLSYIAACNPVAMSAILAEARKVEAMEREIAELRKALTDASDAISAFADSVFNDNGDMTVNLGLATGDDYIRAYFADRRARALLSKESADDQG